jgi:hypothetical protein
MIIKLGKFYYKLSGYQADGCYHNCKRFIDSFGYILADKERHIIKQSLRLIPTSDHSWASQYSYKYKGAY